MNHKSVIAVLVGMTITIMGILEFFLRTPGARNNPTAKLGMVVFILIGCAIMVAVVLYHQQTPERFFLAGVSAVSLTIPLIMLGYFLSGSKWHWSIWPFTAAIFFSGVFLITHGIAKSKPVKIVLSDNGPECSKCYVVFPLLCKRNPIRNGCE